VEGNSHPPKAEKDCFSDHSHAAPNGRRRSRVARPRRVPRSAGGGRFVGPRPDSRTLRSAASPPRPPDAPPFPGRAPLGRHRRRLPKCRPAAPPGLGRSAGHLGTVCDGSGGDAAPSRADRPRASAPATGARFVDLASASDPLLDRWTRFHEAIAALPEEERELFHLVWYMGADQNTIADLLECSPRTVKSRWRVAREKVRAALGGQSPE
jgi:hypothetical protein